MRALFVTTLLWAATIVPLCGTVQQQTGAPAGVAVPAAPSSVPDATNSPAAPQTAVFRIRVVDGRNGEAMRNAHLTLWYDEQAGTGYTLATDSHGLVNMPAPVGQPIRVLVTPLDAVDCRRRGIYDVPTGFNLQSIAAHGQSAENHCGSIAQHTRPGELVLFARPPRWYEGINRGAGN